MSKYVYETHLMADPSLPFIFHKAFEVTDTSMLYNWHENIELLWCIDGEGTLHSGAQVLPFSTGDIALINTNTPHCVCAQGSVQYRCLIIANRFFQDNGIDVDTLRFQPLLRDPVLYSQLEAVNEAYLPYANHPSRSACSCSKPVQRVYCGGSGARQYCSLYSPCPAIYSRTFGGTTDLGTNCRSCWN